MSFGIIGFQWRWLESSELFDVKVLNEIGCEEGRSAKSGLEN